ncbi:ABC1 kinase family protein [Chondromyces crocatus]|uniref:ABC1 kinase family protein n=1 Tax=Chondromyces crocatus TaxID=52 RepID=UPI001C54D823|nr:AarF/UbiB family protein [Chondromyces crocatus]
MAPVHADPEKYALRVRLFMESMGGLWVKVGQILAMRRDLFSEAFCNELSRLQNRAHGFPAHYARSIIEEELGAPIDSIFVEFDDRPLAAASVGQAHRARLKDNGVEVVVKVQRPNAKASFEKDFVLLRRLVRFLTFIRFSPESRWSEMYTEVESAILEELDYRQEATSLRRMRKNLRDHKIYVPKVFLSFCTDRVLVMEMVHGVYMSEYIQTVVANPDRARAWLKENQISASRLGKRLWFSYLRQLFEDNLYHCDLHPGNILVMRKGRITLIDFGSVATSDRSQLEKFRLLYKAMGDKDFRKVAEMFLLLAPPLPNKDLTEAKEDVVRLFREFESLVKVKALPYHQKSLSRLLGDTANVLASHGVPAAWDFLRVTRSSTTLDASLMFLVPDIDFLKIAQQHVRSESGRQQNKKRSDPKLVRAQLANMAEQGGMLTKFAENAYFEGEYLRQRALPFEGYISKATHVGFTVFHLLARAALLSALVLIVGYAHQHFDAFGALRGQWVYAQLERIPRLSSTFWLLCTFVALYTVHEFTLMRGIFEEPEPTRPEGDRR